VNKVLTVTKQESYNQTSVPSEAV